MAWINKPPKKTRTKNGLSKLATQVYNTSRWRNIRAAKLMENPLCEKCLQNGIIKPATDVHHIIRIQTKDNLLEMKEIAYDYSNLMSLCEECHQKEHKSNLNKEENGML